MLFEFLTVLCRVVKILFIKSKKIIAINLMFEYHKC